ncbi:hypothetical protein GCM10009804_41360 [Kribbella hippodromi]|uniref:Uncharacterized protein n=1 Tax=Kribbella hippodromi TaxID=434347 RepID=A0ABN2DMM0_9ACTN
MERATRDGLKRMRRPRRLPAVPSRIWTDDEWHRLQLGYRAQDMDEKWHVFAEENVVFLHRSWTGAGMFEVTFTPADDGGRRISQVTVRREWFDPIRRLLSRSSRSEDESHCSWAEAVLGNVASADRSEDSD